MQGESPPQIWLPEAHRFSSILQSNAITYAIFGAGALAVHKVMQRPTQDIDFVVMEYEKTVNLLNEQPNLTNADLTKEKDGIQVADFYFDTGVSVQIWDNNLYSLPMTSDAWSRVVIRNIPGFGLVRSISMEDLIVSKVGRFMQQKAENAYEARKNVTDIIATIDVLKKPDYQYIMQRLKDGARRESSSQRSKIHTLDWYFIREIETYLEVAKDFDSKKISKFLSTIVINIKTPSVEYHLLHTLRKVGNISKFQQSFMLDDEATSLLLKRWKSFVRVNGDNVDVNSKDIQQYIISLGPQDLPDYAKYLVHRGRSKL